MSAAIADRPRPPPCNPITTPVLGAPYQPHDRVRVVAAVDRDICDVTPYIGRFGVVAWLEYRCGCGQSYPKTPMVGVKFHGGAVEEFWPEELEART
jgi:hypothetical protein